MEDKFVWSAEKEEEFKRIMRSKIIPCPYCSHWINRVKKWFSSHCPNYCVDGRIVNQDVSPLQVVIEQIFGELLSNHS